MTTFNNFKGIKEQINFFKTIYAHCISDLEQMETLEEFAYNIDFLFLYPYLFPTPTEETKPFFPHNAKIMNSLVKANDFGVKFKLVFSGASFLELLDQIEHIRHHLQYSVDVLSEYCDKFGSGEKLEENFELIAKTPNILKALETVSSVNNQNKNLIKPINKMRDLISNKELIPMGDLFEAKEIKSYYNRYKSMLEKMKELRLDNDSKKHRPYSDSIFHYKVDSLNITLSMAINHQEENRRLFFMTNMGPNLDLCKYKNEMYGRNSLVPLFILNSHKLNKKRDIGDDIQEFFCDALRQADKVIKIMSKYDSFQNLPKFEGIKIVDFYKYYVRYLSTEKIEIGNSADNISKSEVIEMLSKPKQLKEAFDSAEFDLLSISRELNEYYQEFDDGIYEKFDFKDDPIVKKIYKNLKLDK